MSGQEEMHARAVQVVALRILELPVPLGGSEEDEVVVAMAESILSPLSRCNDADAKLSLGFAGARAVARFARTSEAAARASQALRDLQSALYDEAEAIKLAIWLGLPSDVRGRALVARRTANAVLLELVNQEEVSRYPANECYPALSAWNNGEAVLAEAIMWDIAGAEAHGVSLEDVYLDEDDAF